MSKRRVKEFDEWSMWALVLQLFSNEPYNRLMTSTEARIAENHCKILQRVEAACRRSGRSASDVTVLAVTKYAEIEWVRSLVALGIEDLGESRPQQFVERVPQFSELIHWHLIGPLQRNKVRRVLPLVACIHSVDCLRLLAAIDRLADELNLRPNLLLEVNVSGESSKHGFSPQELTAEWETVVAFRRVRIQGLMTMAPLSDDPDNARPVFRRLRTLRDQLSQSWKTALPDLSMGMSNDFEIAIEEGATIVRIGGRFFEGLSIDRRN